MQKPEFKVQIFVYPDEITFVGWDRSGSGPVTHNYSVTEIPLPEAIELASAFLTKIYARQAAGQNQ